MIAPCPGLSMRRTPEGIPVIRVHYSADPAKNANWVAHEKPKYSTTWWAQEMEIQAHARSGQRVYPEFDPVIHVLPPDRIPTRGCRFMSIDPHPRTPHSFLWVLIDAWSDWYIYRELWPSVVCGIPRLLRDDEPDNVFTIREYAETLAVLEGNSIEWKNAETDRERGSYVKSLQGERIVYRFMDQAGKGFRATGEGEETESYSTRYERYGIRCIDPRKSHKSGEDALRALLKPRHHEIYGTWPRLHVSSDCPETILEFIRYRYKTTRRYSDERELKQVGVESRCHSLDNARYIGTAGLSYTARLAS
jgi:hypothetical protein